MNCMLRERYLDIGLSERCVDLEPERTGDPHSPGHVFCITAKFEIEAATNEIYEQNEGLRHRHDLIMCLRDA